MSKYGCYDRDEFTPLVTIGTEQVLEDGRLVARPVTIPNFSAADSRCKFTLSDLGKIDPRCSGCGWKS